MKKKKSSGRVLGGERLELVKQAAQLYQDFSGHMDEFEVHRVRVRDWPKNLVAIGTFDAISYTTVRDGKTERYEHEFRKSARPLFCVSPDGHQIVLIGGSYKFTDRGIVDQ